MQQLLRTLINRVRYLQQSIQRYISPYFVRHRFLSACYYFFFDTSFWYEQQAVLKGKCQYYKNNGMQNGSSSLLRRNIHRLEKGLIMQPRRNVFALDYIEETINTYRQCEEVGSKIELSELSWAADVLNEYFSVVDKSHPIIASALASFSVCRNLFIENKKIPYLECNKVKHSIEPEQLAMLFKARRSVRWYQQEKVPNELILAAVDMALQAPSACNRQPFEFLVVEPGDKLDALAILPGGTAGFADNIPCLIAIVGDLSCYPFERDRHVIYIDGSLVSMQLMLAFETLGLSSCPINWPELHRLDLRVSKLLEIPQHKRVVMFLSVGFAKINGKIAFSDKKIASQVVVFK
ncbi:nitroreductase family protein [Pseudoalteromonas tunicata]|uniref:nitroreductase family protein n=1 Tax=Pseudoalteromonas tunicata TaxID=314281 RepID=UPI00273E2ED1|nr:nitroreductase family protein [Pseudoalteromonas tunicata]MDP4982701.1 nitroreductase family protein [Pseudoalteromonas tunicata]